MRRKQDFDLLKMHFQRGVRCSPPLSFGVDDRNLHCHTLVRYIAGESGASALPKLQDEHQYRVGLDEGRELWALHQLTHPSDNFDWYSARVTKYQSQVALARQRNLIFRKQVAVERFIDSAIALLRESETRIQHDDYQLDNLIVHDGMLQCTIDFNRCDWEDPVEDFYKVPWFITSISIPFSRGQVEGYLEVVSPHRFWERYNLLVALNLHASLVFANDEGMEWWPDRLDKIVIEHDFEGGGPPRWFVESS